MNVDAYLRRIGIEDENLPADAATLRRLQKQHLLHVPFENLDIHWKRPIVLEPARFFEKVVAGGRGGFCYELNGLFNELLRSLGYTTRLVSARVAIGEGKFGPEYDHAAIIATIDGEEWLVDVGFGAFTIGPLKVALGEEQVDEAGAFVISEHEDGYLLVSKDGQPSYMFKPQARDLSEFAGMCEFHQTSPESHFMRGRLCSLLTANGRKTLQENRFFVTRGDEKTESEVDFDEMLFKEFGIVNRGDTETRREGE